ncbi:MAG: hypothetical protein ACKVQU_34175 [Burkholderiales bacterium]
MAGGIGVPIGSGPLPDWTSGQSLTHQTQYTYNSTGDLTQVTDALGDATRYRYDNVGRRVAIFDAFGQETRSEYNGVDALTKRTDARAGVTQST